MKTSKEVSKEDLKEMMQLVPVKEVYVEALQVKHPIIHWEIHSKGKKDYWKIITLGGNTSEFIEFGDSYEAPSEESGTSSASESSAKKKGRTVAITTEDMQKRRNDVKARTTLLLALPDEHQLRFSKYKTAKELWGAILKTFGENEATKKTKKNQLKQQYGNFKEEGSEILEQTFNRLQAIVKWLISTIVWRNRNDLDTLSLDDVYNHLKVYEPEVQKKSESNSHNMAFISSANTSSGKGEVNTVSIPTTSTQVSPASADVAAASISHDTVYAYIASQSNGSQIKYEDINQIDENDIEEMDIKAPRSQDRGRREIYKQGSKEEEQALKALMAIDGVGCDWSYMANEEENHALVADDKAPTEFALMAKSSSSFENDIKKEKEGLDSKLTGFESASKDLDTLLGFYSPLKKNMSWTGLPAFDDDTITDYSRPSPSIKSNTSDLQNSNSSVSEHGESLKSILSKPMIKFVKAADSPTDIKTNKVETVRKSSVRYAEMYRNTSKSPKGNSQNNIDDKGYWDSGCSRHMTGNISYRSDYEPYDGGYVSFGQGGGKITGKADSLTVIKTNKAKTARKPHVRYAEMYMNTAKSPNASADESMLWHRRLGHLNFKTMNKLVRHNLVKVLPSKCFENEHTCVACLKGKQHKASCKTKLVNLVSKPLHNLHMDLFGPNSVSSLNHKWYCLVVTDDFSRCDNGGEFKNKEMNEFCNRKWIKREFCTRKGTKKKFSNARTPQQNRVAKRRNKTLIKVARTMLADAKLPVTFWAEAVNTACTKDVASQDVKKDVSSLRYIALPNWFHEVHLESSTSNAQDTCNTTAPESSGNSNPTATSKNSPDDQMETLTVESIIPTVSLPVPTACLDDSSETLSATRLISKKVTSQDETPSLDNISTLSNRFEDILGVSTNTGDTNRVEADLGNMEYNISASPTPTFKIHKDHPKSQTIGPVDTPVQTRHKSKAMEEQSFIVTIHQKTNPDHLQFCLFSCFLSQDEPKKISDAFKDPSWVEAMQKELLQFKIQNVWILVDCPKGEEGIDYEEVFALVTRVKAIKLFLAYASFMGFTVYQMDVKSAFLYGTINEEAPRAWYGTLFKYLLANGFQRGTIGQTLFIIKHRGDFLLVQVYVDDIIFGSSNLLLCREFEALMHDKFQISAMGELNFFLGLQVLQKKDIIFLSQDKYVGDILKKFGYSDVRSANTPMDKENPWGKDGPGKDVDLHLYRSMIRSLMYLTASRPDIMFAVCTCARHQVTPKECHLHVVKRIFRYLKGHPKLGLWYPKESPFDLVAYSDSDYGGATQDRKSTTRGCQFLERRLISWQCKKQTIVATSTTKAKYVAATSGCG
nr:hypothetical protein [Tanacetum cinerariifolium]